MATKADDIDKVVVVWETIVGHILGSRQSEFRSRTEVLWLSSCPRTVLEKCGHAAVDQNPLGHLLLSEWVVLVSGAMLDGVRKTVELYEQHLLERPMTKDEAFRFSFDRAVHGVGAFPTAVQADAVRLIAGHPRRTIEAWLTACKDRHGSFAAGPGVFQPGYIHPNHNRRQL